MAEVKKATDIISLPSKGWYYPEGSPLAQGTLEVFYMTAAHENIIMSKNLIQRGIVIDKLMEALIAQSDVNYEDLLSGDKDGLMVAARIMGYGKDYEVTIDCPNCKKQSTHNIDLENIPNKPVKFDENHKNNAFDLLLPISKQTITFKLLTHKDEKSVNAEIDAMTTKLSLEVVPEITLRMKRAIIAVNGVTDRITISNFVDNMQLRDARAFRKYAQEVNPGVDMTFDFECTSCGFKDRLEVPITIGFFWPI